jgi:hypothetical protein
VSRPSRSSFPLWPAAVLAVALAILATACSAAGAAGPSVASLATPTPEAAADGSPEASGSPQASADPQEAFLAFAACMREHGVDMPDPEFQSGPNGGGMSIAISNEAGQGGEDAVAKADEACRHLIAGVTLGKGDGPGMDPATQEALLQYSACMREHGIDMPDPVFNADGGGAMMKIGGPGTGSGPAFDPSSTEFKAAEEACRHLMPGGGKGGPGLSVSGPASGASGTDQGPVTQSKP